MPGQRPRQYEQRPRVADQARRERTDRRRGHHRDLRRRRHSSARRARRLPVRAAGLQRHGGRRVLTAPRERPRQVVGVGALLLRPDGAVLIGHRIKRDESASRYLPGGHVEPGETFEAAALREIAEETGIRAVTDARAFTIALRTDAEMTHVTAGVVVRTTPEARPAVLEPEVFDQSLIHIT
ncbi:MAG: NUDIX domain-containing protein, partial [Actinomadura rubrobrunea]|nr:NUDIX domain-containing protein [Actinomadura rubrobrunea]